MWHTTRISPNASLPKVMIARPITGRAISTGFTALSAGKLERLLRGSLLVKCESCGQYHEWSREMPSYANGRAAVPPVRSARGYLLVGVQKLAHDRRG